MPRIAKHKKLLDILGNYDYKHSTALPASLGNAATKGNILITEEGNRAVDMRRLDSVGMETQNRFFPDGIEDYNTHVIVLYVRDDIKTILYDTNIYKRKYRRLGDETTITDWLNGN